LFDTFTKDGRSLVDFVPEDQLADWTAQARSSAEAIVLAGSLSIGLLERVRRYEPDFLAVRGAVCGQGREGEVSESRIRRFAAAIKRAFGPIKPPREAKY
jgi:uncharacterized protein (UPF0264 family)